MARTFLVVATLALSSFNLVNGAPPDGKGGGNGGGGGGTCALEGLACKKTSECCAPLSCEGSGSRKVCTAAPSPPPPSPSPSPSPTPSPSAPPSPSPPPSPPPPLCVLDNTCVTYSPGHLSTVAENGLYLSQGLKSRIIAKSGSKVDLVGGGQSAATFHSLPDAGACFANPSVTTNVGGWAYVSNSEVGSKSGGVGSIIFNSAGEVIDYIRPVTGTSRNCGGGKTPSGKWITCEENGSSGQVYVCDPFVANSGKMTVLGEGGGNYESAAYYAPDGKEGIIQWFVTDDSSSGELRRFTPDSAGEDSSLHGTGTFHYLQITSKTGANQAAGTGTFAWTTSLSIGQSSANTYFPSAEGIDIRNGKVFFVSKSAKLLYILDLAAGTFEASSTLSGAFNNQPDQIKFIIDDPNHILYFCEDGGSDCGVHGRDNAGNFFTILNSATYTSESTGLAFSPDKKHMYVSFQSPGHIFDIWREDGQPFTGGVLDIKYHTE